MIFLHQSLILIDYLKKGKSCVIQCFFCSGLVTKRDPVRPVHQVNMHIRRCLCHAWIIASKAQVIIPRKHHAPSVPVNVQPHVAHHDKHIIQLHKPAVGGKIPHSLIHIHNLFQQFQILIAVDINFISLKIFSVAQKGELSLPA